MNRDNLYYTYVNVIEFFIQVIDHVKSAFKKHKIQYDEKDIYSGDPAHDLLEQLRNFKQDNIRLLSGKDSKECRSEAGQLLDYEGTGRD